MENINSIAHFYLISIAWTIILFSPLASTKLTGRGFTKLISAIAIAALILSFFTQKIQVDLNNISSSISIIILIVFYFYYPESEKKNIFWKFLYLIYALLLLPPLISKTTIIPHLLSAALLLGIVNYAMILGHWYLVVPKLTEKPLIISNYIIWGLLLFKISLSVINSFVHHDFFVADTQRGDGYAFNTLLLLMRFSFGYIVIFALSIFNYKLLKIRSLQSATGILYAMTFFVFMGELVSLYLSFKFGLMI